MSDATVKDAVRQRDGYRCVECGMTDEQHRRTFGRGLEIHRVTPGSEYAVDETCVTLCKPCHWTKPKSRRTNHFVRLDGEVFRRASMVVCHKRAKQNSLRVSDYLGSILTDAVDRDYQAMQREISQEGA